MRPITLLYGFNNAGKSALGRLLPLLDASLSLDSPGPLDLRCPAVGGASFRDLKWKGELSDEEDPYLELGMEWEGGAANFSLQWWDAGPARDSLQHIAIRRFELEAGDEKITGVWDPVESERRGESLYELQAEGDSFADSIEMRFDGLLPRVVEGSGDFSVIADVASELREFHRRVGWLGATRRRPERIVRPSPSPSWRMSHDGSDAVQVMASLPRSIHDDVSSWYEAHVHKRLVPLDPLSDTLRPQLETMGEASFPVDLVDSGEGLLQVFPVLLSLSIARLQRDRGPSCLVIEEPESHLHPRLQRALADRICEVAADDTPPTIVMETHSAHVLLAVQLAVARGDLPLDRVAVYWVEQREEGGESQAHRVEVDSDGRLGKNWPPGVFEDDLQLSRELLKLQRSKRTQ